MQKIWSEGEYLVYPVTVPEFLVKASDAGAK